MNTTKQLQQIKLDQWAVLCKEQAQSGLSVKQWCDQNGCTIHTYNYWKHRLKKITSNLHFSTSFPSLHLFPVYCTNRANRTIRALKTRSPSF